MSLRDVLVRRGGPVNGTQPMRLVGMSRNDLGSVARELGWTRGAEIGVWKGAFSEVLLNAHDGLHLLCVDPWQSYPAWVDTKNKMAAEDGPRIMEQAYQQACSRLSGRNCTIVRKFSADAASDVPDGSLDFVYIDGNHVFEAVKEDLAIWAPKVRAGGAVIGHDYRNNPKKPFIQVVEAVHAHVKAHGITAWFITAADSSPSFLWEAA